MKRNAVLAMLLVLIAFTAGAAEREPEFAPHPRVLLNPRRLARVRSLAEGGDARFLELRAQGEAMLQAKTGAYLPPGYARAGWADAATAYALLHLLESDDALRKAFAEEALVYMKALANDYAAVGDGRGGPEAVRDDGGYPIRNHAIGLVTAYDWLYPYEGFSLEQKTRFALRLDEWIDWYEGWGTDQKGHMAEGPPWENCFAAYFAAKALTAAVTYEENPKAQLTYLKEVRHKLYEDVLPLLSRRLAGGYPCEGWAYRCGYDWTVAALTALENGIGEEFDKSFFRDIVYAVIHSTKPDGKHIYDGGDWEGESAGYPLPLALMARLSVLLDGSEAAGHARFYVMDFAVKDDVNRLSPVESLACIDPAVERMDFTLHGRLSHSCPGTGMTFFRSSWQKGAFWSSFQSGSPHLSEHQNNDQGHITVNYLGSDLLIDAGMWREKIGPNAVISNYASGTGWHNSIMIDDLGRETGLSQGPYGEGRAVAFEDTGKYVYARADITGAYACDPDRKDSNLAKHVAREVWFIRPRALVVIDDVEPLHSSYPTGVLWHLPHRAKARLQGVELAAEIDKSVLKMFFMLPSKMNIGLSRQFGTRPGDERRGFYTQTVSVRDATDRYITRFVTLITAARSDTAGGEAAKEEEMSPMSMQASCVVIKAPDRFVAVGRAERPEGSLLLKMPLLKNVDLYLSGLKPNSNYLVKPSATVTLTVRIVPSDRISGTMTSPAGTLTTSLKLKGFVIQ